MLNHINLMGRVCKDIELRRTGSGTPVASFTIACDRDFGEKETDFIEIVCWKNTAEFVSKHFTKGNLIAVSGRLQIRKWTDRDGNKRYNAEVVADNCYFCERKNNSNPAFDAAPDFVVLDGDKDGNWPF